MNPKLFYSIDPIMIWRFDEAPRVFQGMFHDVDNNITEWILYISKAYIQECYECFYGEHDVLGTQEFAEGKVIALGYFSNYLEVNHGSDSRKGYWAEGLALPKHRNG